MRARLQHQQLRSSLARPVQVVVKPRARAWPDAARVQLQLEIAHSERRRPLGQLLDVGQDQAVCLVGTHCLLVRLPTHPLRRLELKQRLFQVLRLFPQTRARGGSGGGGSGEGSGGVEVSASAGAGNGARNGTIAGAGAGADAGDFLLLLALDPLVGLLGDGSQLLIQLFLLVALDPLVGLLGDGGPGQLLLR